MGAEDGGPTDRCPDDVARVVVYSDQAVLAHGLGCLIVADPALELNGCCRNLAGLKEYLASGTADLAVVDLTKEITIAALNELQNLAPECKMILWTDLIAADFAIRALTFGVRGVLGKSLSLEAHRRCLHRVHSGELWFEKSLTDSFRAGQRVLLTPRESQLINLLSRGFKNKEISCELGLTEGTVKVYLSHLLHKSGAKDRLTLGLQGLKNLSMPGTTVENQGGVHFLLIDHLCR
jgi:DNA-binding NarL/FixJ family response regulator